MSLNHREVNAGHGYASNTTGTAGTADRPAPKCVAISPGEVAEPNVVRTADPTRLIWLTTLKENTDPSSYDQVFQQQLDAIKDKVPAETYGHVKNLNWGNYIASQLRKANFHDDIDDHLQHIVTKLLVEPGQLFRGYNPDRHGPLDRRFGASVRNEIAKLISKVQNRRKYVPTVPLASHDRAVNQEPSQAFLRDGIMAKIGKLGVAVLDCLQAGIDPSVLVGRVELGSPSLYRVKKVRREVGELAARSMSQVKT